jgi:hypothetical protein
MPAFEVKAVGLGIDRLRRARRRAELERQRRRDLRGDFVLQREHVPLLAGELVGPDLLVRVRAAQPRDDADRRADTAHAAVDEVGHVEFLADLLRGNIFSLERKRRHRRRHAQPRHAPEHVEQLLADAVGKIFVALVVG